MSVEAVRGLRNRWRANSLFTERLERAFDTIGFTDAYVSRCAENAAMGRAPSRAKDIKDNVWGMIELDAPTLRLLDSPLLQRLRGIKQLGMSYLTYPSAEHSRFAHSLGIGYVASRFLDSCRKRPSEGYREEAGGSVRYVDLLELAPLTSSEILHAAILHDSGHMPFSHASEGVLSSKENEFQCGGRTIAEFLFDLEDELEKNVDLSEALSVSIVLSRRFGEFYKHYIAPGIADDETLLKIASLVAGLAPNERLAGVADIISSAAVDSDKIDYINRDALACGIPIGVDVARLFIRSGFVRAQRDQLIRLKDNPAAEEIHFVVNSSGMDTLEEISQARAGLYQRVYLHPVTRSAEALLRRALNSNCQATSGTRLTDALDLWVLNDNTLLDALRGSESKDARLYAARILNRDLPKKACAFSALIAEAHMPFDIFLPRLSVSDYTTLRKHITNAALTKLIGRKLNVADAERLEGAIKSEALKVYEAIPEEHAGLRPTLPLDLVLLVGGTYLQTKKKDCLVLQNGELLPASDFTTTEEHNDATDIFKAVGFVMCDPDWRPLVLIAARNVIYRLERDIQPASFPSQRQADEDEISLGREGPEALSIGFIRRTILGFDGVVRRSNVPRARVSDIMSALEETSFFDDEPLLARRVPIENVDVAKISAKLLRFRGERSWQVRSETVAAFLDQFPPKLRPAMRRALSEIQFLDDDSITESILNVLPSEPVDVVSLSPSSGNHVWTALKREAASRAISNLNFCSDLRGALKAPTERPLVFVDDNVASATQARAQFLTWMGVPTEKWPAELQGEDGIFTLPLDEAERRALAGRDSRVVVCAALETSSQVLSSCVNSLGMTRFAGVVSERSLTSVPWPDDLKAFLEEVGYHLLASTKFRGRELSTEDEEFCRGMAFGYGNIGGLTATSTNVPSSTITALWSPGIFKESPWMPLMIRQKKMRWLTLG